MQLIRHRPASPLDRYIECFWWSQRDDAQHYCEHMLPSGGTQLVFSLHDRPILCSPTGSARPFTWSRGIVHGPQSGYYVAGPKPKGSAVGVSFRPGAAGALLGVATSELADRHVELDAIWGRRGIDLHEQLMSARGPEVVFRILEQNLLARLHRPLLMHPVVAHALVARALDPASSVRIADLQRESGYSHRHFIELFRSSVGLGPKHFFRIRRFNRAVRCIAAGDARGLGDIAACCGYSDQAHLTREFREFAGIAPTKYRPGGRNRPLHHRVADGRGSADR